MITNVGKSSLGSIEVATTHGRGATPEELAERAVNRIISVGDNSHPLVAEQARAFKQDVKNIMVFYLKEAVRSNQVTVANAFNKAGYPELINLLDER